jgi:serine/threonine protein kinase
MQPNCHASRDLRPICDASVRCQCQPIHVPSLFCRWSASRVGVEMSPHSNRRAKNAPNTVRVDGRNFSIRDRIRINGRKYLLLARLSATPRERWFACDPSSGFQPRSILRLPGDNSTSQHVRSLRRLKSDSLPQIVDYQHRQKETLVALSWVRGISLCEYVQRFRSGKVDMPTPFHCVRLIRQLAHALNTMHKYANVIHGDLKPANLVITRKPGRLTLIDFGSAWPIDMTGVRCEGDGISRTYSAPEPSPNSRARSCGGTQR